MARITELIQYFDEVLPKTLSEPMKLGFTDNDGVMVLPHSAKTVKRVLVALDATSRTIEYAKNISADLIVTHHPLIFNPLKALEATDSYGKRIIACVKNDIAVLSYHTRLDEVDGGVNDCLAEAIGLTRVEKMEPCGRIGEFVKEMSYTDFCTLIKENLGIKSVTGVKTNNRVKKVALVSGSGKDFIADVIKAGADTYLTGELTHSAMIEAKELGLNVVCGTHYATENVVLPRIKEILLMKFPYLEIEILPFAAECEYGI